MVIQGSAPGKFPLFSRANNRPHPGPAHRLGLSSRAGGPTRGRATSSTPCSRNCAAPARTHKPHGVLPLRQLSALVILASWSLPGCDSSKTPPTYASDVKPLGGPTQTLKVDVLGPISTAFTFFNTTQHSVAVPHVLPSCGCTETDWSSPFIDAAGQATLKLTTIATQQTAKQYSATLLWSDHSTSELRWMVVTPRTQGLHIAPTQLTLQALQQRHTLPVAFLADYNQSPVPHPFTVVVAARESVLRSRLMSLQTQGDHALSGVVEVPSLALRTVVNASEEASTSLSISAPGLMPQTINISK